MVLAGAGVGVSLLLDWLADADGLTGYEILRQGLDNFGSIFSTGLWQPVVIVVGAAILLLIGLTAFVPGKSRRLLGLIALLVALAMVAAVLVALSDSDFDLSVFAAGFYVVIGATALGLLGALKAAVTPPKRVS
jgi:small basic protein